MNSQGLLPCILSFMCSTGTPGSSMNILLWYKCCLHNCYSLTLTDFNWTILERLLDQTTTDHLRQSKQIRGFPAEFYQTNVSSTQFHRGIKCKYTKDTQLQGKEDHCHTAVHCLQCTSNNIKLTSPFFQKQPSSAFISMNMRTETDTWTWKQQFSRGRKQYTGMI